MKNSVARFYHFALRDKPGFSKSFGVARSRYFSTVRLSETPGETVPKAEETSSLPTEDASVKKPMTCGRFLLYATGAVSGSIFSYYFYQSGFNLHNTEIAISRKLAELPFYYPPGPGAAEKNTRLPDVSIPESLVGEISGWFIYQDTAAKNGVRRNNVLDLFGELGLCDPEKENNTDFLSVGDEEFRKSITRSVNSFVERGRGRLTEYKRQSGVSIQETIELLNELVLEHQSINPNIIESIDQKLKEILAKLVDMQNQQAGVPGMALSGQPVGAALEEVEVSDMEVFDMELAQLERTKAELSSKSSLSEAERARLSFVKSQISEVKKLIRNA